MSQMSFSDAEYAGKRKKTRREVFLCEMEQVVPWKALLDLISPHYPVAGRGLRPYRPSSSPDLQRVAFCGGTRRTTGAVARGSYRADGGARSSRSCSPSVHQRRDALCRQ